MKATLSKRRLKEVAPDQIPLPLPSTLKIFDEVKMHRYVDEEKQLSVYQSKLQSVLDLIRQIISMQGKDAFPMRFVRDDKLEIRCARVEGEWVDIRVFDEALNCVKTITFPFPRFL
jgi:hypothetical protein